MAGWDGVFEGPELRLCCCHFAPHPPRNAPGAAASSKSRARNWQRHATLWRVRCSKRHQSPPAGTRPRHMTSRHHGNRVR